MEKVKVIAEIGENFIGDLQIAKDLITSAAKAGADIVKFQSYLPETFKEDDPEYEWFSKVSLSNDDHKILKQHAQANHIQFMSAPFSLERAQFLCEELGEKEIKIASGMMMNFEVLDYINGKVDTVYISTGMATLTEIKEALSHLDRVNKVHIFHCITQYPCKDEDANLLAIKHLQESFPEYSIGYSDHTIGIDACVFASCIGASVIEKHYTFDKNATEGTDHELSATFEDLQVMIQQINKVNTLFGSGNKTPATAELEIKDFVRNRFV